MGYEGGGRGDGAERERERGCEKERGCVRKTEGESLSLLPSFERERGRGWTRKGNSEQESRRTGATKKEGIYA